MRLTLVVLAWALGGFGQLDLDCARALEARQQIGRTQLSEIEQAEDLQRSALEQALARCPRDAACRAAARRRFEAAWARQKAEIEARYAELLREFQARCRGLLASTIARRSDRRAIEGDEPCAESSFSESGSWSCGSSPTRHPAPTRS